MADNFDVFDQRELDDENGHDSAGSSPHGPGFDETLQGHDDRGVAAATSGAVAGSSRHAGARRRNNPISTTMRILAILAALAALLISGASVVRAVAPASIAPLQSLNARYMAFSALAVSGVAVILVIVARVTRSRQVRGASVGTGSLVVAILAAVLAGGALLVVNLFPQGIIEPAVRDVAPASDSAKMKQGLEEVAGACTGGWTEPDISGYAGVESAALCKDTRVAFVTFDSTSAAALYRAPITSKIGQLLTQYADNSAAQGDWRIVNGKLWMVFGNAESMSKLHTLWGGTVGTVS